MSTYFSDASFRFLRSLARHNDNAWFNDHRQQYEDHVRQPFLRLLGDLQPALAEVSEHIAVNYARWTSAWDALLVMVKMQKVVQLKVALYLVTVCNAA